jgi:Tol biopolymer transport system component
MWKAPSSHWCWLTSGVAFCAVALAMFAQASTRESVRAELIRLQKQSGLSLVSVEGGGRGGELYVVMFASRNLAGKQFIRGENAGEGAVSSDGKAIAFELRRETERTFSTPSGKVFPQYRRYLGIIRQDGSALREYPDLDEPYGLCWSFDESALTLSVKNLNQGKQSDHSLQILNLDSGTTEEVDAGGYVTTQCWSPDGKQIVYQVGQVMRVYDIQQKQSWALAVGTGPTWSPDGNWIAFLDGGEYYVIRPSGKERKLLFKMKDALTPLWWSPDSRFVAYIRRDRLFEGSWIPEEQGRLRVRRLEDNTEDWAANLFVVHVPSFQWVKGMESNAHAEVFSRRRSLPD